MNHWHIGIHSANGNNNKNSDKAIVGNVLAGYATSISTNIIDTEARDWCYVM
jgi:hypothetical protein